MVYAQIQDVAVGEEGFLIVDLVFWDLETATEVDRLTLNLGSDSEPDPTEWPARLDYDGTSLVLGRELSLLDGTVTIAPLWIASVSEGSVVELVVAGVPSLAK